MPRLTDLIINAKTGRPVKDLLRLDDSLLSRHTIDYSDRLIDRIIGVETVFFALSDELRTSQLCSVLQELEQIASEL